MLVDLSEACVGRLGTSRAGSLFYVIKCVLFKFIPNQVVQGGTLHGGIAIQLCDTTQFLTYSRVAMVENQGVL